MSQLVIADIPLTVSAQGPAKRAAERVGSTSRTYNGGLRSTVRAEKRVWGFTSGLLTVAAAEAVEAAVALAAHVVCSGNALNTTVTCEVELGDSPYVVVSGGDGLGYMRRLTLTLREV